ncbi:MAG: hypothetical protein COB76_04885 [Alphaproteobacteria bacterium]|nr:MAG: hypothetical protein COB76_04885 [Alphaproteobacteria bacterium]
MNQDFIYNGPIQNRVSCYMGDLTPSNASCNMVGDQPLFYIDDSADAEDMALLDGMLSETGEFIHDEDLIETLRSRIDAYDRSASSLEAMNIVPTTDLFDAAFKTTPTQITLKDIIETASQSGTFKAYIDGLTALGVSIELSADGVTSFYNRDTKTIFVNSNLSLNKAVHAVSKAARLAWQHAQGTLMNPLRFQPEDAIVINRLMAADQDVAAVTIAWELRLAGYTSLWNELMTGSDYDLCSAYAMEAMTNFRSIKNGLAPRATFEKWFISGRCKSLDREIIQLMLSNNTDYIFEDEDVSRMIATDSVAKMGARPLGKNYLSPIVTQIMVDGLYTEVRDRANANFLWFITFEKKMEQAEQKLQESGEISSVAPRDALQDTNNATHAEIITFPTPKCHTSGADSGNDIGASVYYIDHFRAF